MGVLNSEYARREPESETADLRETSIGAEGDGGEVPHLGESRWVEHEVDATALEGGRKGGGGRGAVDDSGDGGGAKDNLDRIDQISLVGSRFERVRTAFGQCPASPEPRTEPSGRWPDRTWTEPEPRVRFDGSGFGPRFWTELRRRYE